MSKNSYLLTEEGLKKVNATFVEFCKKTPSIEEMADLVGMDSDTIRRLLRRTGGVNQRTIDRLCDGISTLNCTESHLKENVDYILREQCNPTSDPSRHQREKLMLRIPCTFMWSEFLMKINVTRRYCNQVL